MQSGSNLTALALTEELIPSPRDPVPICLDHLQQLTKSPSVVAIIVGYFNFRFQPELHFQVVFLNVDMNLFLGEPSFE
jgi:hypothetical protein